MANALVITFIVIFITAAIVIIIGNTFSIFVFWTQRFHLKRTCFLLINLAAADLLVEISEPIVLGTEKIRKMTAVEEQVRSIKSPSSAFQVLALSASVFFLATISLERVFAVLYPLRHRVISTRAYVYSIIIGWAAGVCMAGISLLQKFVLGRNMYGGVVTHAWMPFHICAGYPCKLPEDPNSITPWNYST